MSTIPSILAYEIYYGTRETHIIVSPICLSKCRRRNTVCIPADDHERNLFFSDPAPGHVKSIFLHCRQTFHTAEYGVGHRIYIRCGPGFAGLWIEGDSGGEIPPDWVVEVGWGNTRGNPLHRYVLPGSPIQQVASIPPSPEQDAALAAMVADGWAAVRWLPFEPVATPTIVVADMGVFIELLLYEVNAPVRDQRLVETRQIWTIVEPPPLASSLLGFLGFALVSNPGFYRRGVFPMSLLPPITTFPLEIVVARYEEPLGWLSLPPFKNHPALVYNKGAAPDFCPSPNIMQGIQLPNVGRETHTYLHHIVERWDTLSEITVFLPGSCDLPNKAERAANVVATAAREGQSVLSGDRYSRPLQEEYAGFEAHGRYISNHAANRVGTADTDLLQGARFRPFGVWFRHHFGDYPATFFSVNAIFAISRRHIQQHSLHYYRELLAEVSGSANPEEGHFFERAWEAVFAPLDGAVFLARS